MSVGGGPPDRQAGEGQAQPPRWSYEPDEDPKVKHHWDKPVAGFVEVRGDLVGKCPNNVTLQEAEEILNAGLVWRPRRGWNKPFPKRPYNIRQGIVYVATPTNPGRSYHAFPERPERLPPEMRRPLLELAQQLGCREEIEKWIRG